MRVEPLDHTEGFLDDSSVTAITAIGCSIFSIVALAMALRVPFIPFEFSAV